MLGIALAIPNPCDNIGGVVGGVPRREGSTQRSAGAGGDFPLLKKKMKMEENKSEIVIFKTPDDKISVDVRFEGETVWLTMDDERLKEAGSGDYWKELLARIRDIRSSEKVMYRQVLDL